MMADREGNSAVAPLFLVQEKNVSALSHPGGRKASGRLPEFESQSIRDSLSMVSHPSSKIDPIAGTSSFARLFIQFTNR
jgi:hypothetical protein